MEKCSERIKPKNIPGFVKFIVSRITFTFLTYFCWLVIKLFLMYHQVSIQFLLITLSASDLLFNLLRFQSLNVVTSQVQ